MQIKYTKCELEIFEIIFDNWISNKPEIFNSIRTVYTPQNVLFTDRDNYLTATKDDFYQEAVISIPTDIDKLKKYLFCIWLDDFDEAYIKTLSQKEVCDLSYQLFEKNAYKFINKDAEDKEYELC